MNSNYGSVTPIGHAPAGGENLMLSAEEHDAMNPFMS